MECVCFGMLAGAVPASKAPKIRPLSSTERCLGMVCVQREEEEMVLRMEKKMMMLEHSSVTFIT